MYFHKLIYDSDSPEVQSVNDYEVGTFDLRSFWSGVEFHGNIPDDVRLFVREQPDLIAADVLATPLSWWVFSDRLLDLVWPLVKSDVQVFDAPVFLRSTGTRLAGYKLINPIRLIDCLDLERSEIEWDEENPGEIAALWRPWIRADCVQSVHMFRIKHYPPALMVSDDFAQRLIGKGICGVAFVRCQGS